MEEWLQASRGGIENTQPAVAETPGGLRKGWLEKSVKTLKKEYSEIPAENILKPLQVCLNTFSLSEEPRLVIGEWLQQSLKNPLAEGHEECKADSNQRLEISMKNPEEEGAEAPQLGTQAWLEASMKGIQGRKRKRPLEKSTEDLKQQSCEGPVEKILQWLQGFVESLPFMEEPPPLDEKWLQCCLKNLEKVLRNKNKSPKMA